MTKKDGKIGSEDNRGISADKLKLDANEMEAVSGGKYQEYHEDNTEMSSHSKRAKGRLLTWTGNQNNIR